MGYCQSGQQTRAGKFRQGGSLDPCEPDASVSHRDLMLCLKAIKAVSKALRHLHLRGRRSKKGWVRGATVNLPWGG